MNTNGESFQKRIKRGREFEKWERRQWSGDDLEVIDFEAPSRWKGKRGRKEQIESILNERFIQVVWREKDS